MCKNVLQELRSALTDGDRELVSVQLHGEGAHGGVDGSELGHGRWFD